MEDFIYLLGKVEPLIRKRDTKMRRAISARQQLSVTLQFLATGESFRCLRFQHRIGRTTIMKTCEALYDVLKEDYLKLPPDLDVMMHFQVSSAELME
ncbi:uncharacterized protein LOC121905356 isoform X2 [Thunnus maccoyii]|uniref:uncharacterized protein LOC121905356 isoform X2 n=1 Tax=Thunnus maccoyii TaxID=8240 RepID=UPI001C4B3535|nr:uncharacterized protein LOC121905356 isoform X2 [Thunnus maccoyii]